MNTTSLYERHLALKARMIEYAGFQMPVSYTGISEEHIAVRTGMGIFDVSHMGEILIEGLNAVNFVNYLVTNIIDEDTEKVTYTLLCDEFGYVVDDLLVYVIREDQVLLVVNASNVEKDFEWISRFTEEHEVTARNISSSYSQIAIQGPKTKDIIDEIIGTEVSDLMFMTHKIIPIKDSFIIVSRTGYTGEDGFEVYGTHELVVDIWDRAIDEGATPCGLGARDTLRFEANLPLYGHEISEHINPIEAGLKFAVKFDKYNFIGKQALLDAYENPKRKIVGIELLEKNIPRQGYQLFIGEQEIGVITTGYLLPNQEAPIACALVDIASSKIGTEVFVQIRQKMVPARIRNRKFYNKNYNK